MKLRFARSAETDLEAIADWIAKDNPARALTFVTELRDACQSIADYPEGWPLVPRFEDRGVRRKIHADYLIFYVIEGASVIVIHVLHGARDYGDLLT